jgi:DNA-binding transcriptional ArsR family regulator
VIAKIPETVLSNPNLSDRAKLVYGCLAWHWNGKGTCHPSQALLAKETGKSVRAVGRAISELAAANLVSVKRRQAGSAIYDRPSSDRTEVSDLNPPDRTEVSDLRGSDQTEVSGRIRQKCLIESSTNESTAVVVVADQTEVSDLDNIAFCKEVWTQASPFLPFQRKKVELWAAEYGWPRVREAFAAILAYDEVTSIARLLAKILRGDALPPTSGRKSKAAAPTMAEAQAIQERLAQRRKPTRI